MLQDLQRRRPVRVTNIKSGRCFGLNVNNLKLISNLTRQGSCRKISAVERNVKAFTRTLRGAPLFARVAAAREHGSGVHGLSKGFRQPVSLQFAALEAWRSPQRRRKSVRKHLYLCPWEELERCVVLWWLGL